MGGCRGVFFNLDGERMERIGGGGGDSGRRVSVKFQEIGDERREEGSLYSKHATMRKG